MYHQLFNRWSNIHLLDNSTWDYHQYRFIGSTLWSDPHHESLSSLNDFRQIYYDDNLITREEFVGLHKEGVEFIRTELEAINEEREEAGESGKVPILITHFPPIREGISAPAYKDSGHDQYFGNSLDEMKINPSSIPLWISGHTHFSYDYRIDGTRYLSNQMGHLSEYPTNRFQPEAVFTLPDKEDKSE